MEIICRAPTLLNRGAGYELPPICRPSLDTLLIKIPRWNRKLRYNTFFYSVNWWILVLFKLSVMAGLSNSVIANAYSVQCILCIFFWFNIVLSSNSPFLSVFIAFHFIIIVTVQRKFFVYLLQILLQWVKWRVDMIIYLTKKDLQNEKSMPKTTAKLIIATCIVFS